MAPQHGPADDKMPCTSIELTVSYLPTGQLNTAASWTHDPVRTLRSGEIARRHDLELPHDHVSCSLSHRFQIPQLSSVMSRIISVCIAMKICIWSHGSFCDSLISHRHGQAGDSAREGAHAMWSLASEVLETL